MKGIVYRGLEELVIENHGMAAWEALLDKHAPKNRVYISAQSYPDEELFAMANEVASILNKPLVDVLRVFGEYLFGYLIKKHSRILEQFDGFQSLILGIDSVIHAEVAKLYNEPNLPQISCEQIDDKHILLNYCSVRKLCFCAEGLIYGAGAHYGMKTQIDHQQCMHDGYEQCRMLLTYEGQ
ncbi:hypothetical protein PSECIP111951_02521 [Pseudoalteromonas holothuriae]|uniref:Heme NO-binding domain-containing protein n=1 Tax=Pseudoalteromonas holothuriae TaxID=2963714 RepID=A0A9W4QU93_9GAMM|nr:MULTISPECIES: heme NO-binding domain-containing protein [unclassified Pseudoalteromonas]CAH9053186.1 hypothetical protein PSECIP111854_01121 [Pseudoalteromonas sp. CIP111854]CAH9061593.1 hypothetical protein PSECIP111951_02521 [Pseudoalteromonas sp. CIP111951]